MITAADAFLTLRRLLRLFMPLFTMPDTLMLLILRDMPR